MHDSILLKSKIMSTIKLCESAYKKKLFLKMTITMYNNKQSKLATLHCIEKQIYANHVNISNLLEFCCCTFCYYVFISRIFKKRAKQKQKINIKKSSKEVKIARVGHTAQSEGEGFHT